MNIRYNILLLFFALLTFSGCENSILDIPPPVGAGVNMYSWRTDSLAPVHLEYTVIDTLSRTLPLQLNFIKKTPGEYTLYQVLNGSATSSMTLINRGDSLSISDLTPHSIVPIPPSYSLVHSQTASFSILRKMTHIFATGDNGAFVASDDSSNVFYTVKGLHGWTKSTQIPGITAFSRYFFKNVSAIVAATSEGKIFFSTNSGKTWAPLPTQISGPIAALAFSNKTLYAAIRGAGIYEINTAGSASKLASSLPKIGNGDFTSLAPFVSYNGKIDTSKLIVGTLANGLWLYDRNLDTITPFADRFKIDGKINFILSDSSGFIVGTSTQLPFQHSGIRSLEFT